MSDSSTTKDAVTCAIRHIGTGVYSSGKIRIYLIRKGYSEGVAIEAVRHLIATGYIDDKRASRKVLSARTGKKQESRQYIYKRLLEAGISSDCAEEVVDSLDDDLDTCAALYEASFGKSIEEVNIDSEDEFLKLAQLRGYSLETARSALYRFLDSNK